jgi:AGZA family xanthine/uracil permease-like MFS transporter
MSFLAKVNKNVAESAVGRYFRLEGSGARRERIGSKFTTEIRAGLTTFVTMVNPTLLLSFPIPSSPSCSHTSMPDLDSLNASAINLRTCAVWLPVLCKRRDGSVLPYLAAHMAYHYQ